MLAVVVVVEGLSSEVDPPVGLSLVELSLVGPCPA